MQINRVAVSTETAPLNWRAPILPRVERTTRRGWSDDHESLAAQADSDLPALLADTVAHETDSERMAWLILLASGAAGLILGFVN